MNNPLIRKAIANRTIHLWNSKGISIVGDLYKENTFISFKQLKDEHELPQTSLKNKYLQIWHWVKEMTKYNFPNTPEESLLKNCIHSTRATRGLISKMYNILNNNLPTYNNLRQVAFMTQLTGMT